MYIFLDFIAYCYGAEYTEGQFSPSLLDDTANEVKADMTHISEIDLKALIEENRSLKEQLTARREEQQTYVPKPLDLSEYETRKIYIDTMLI